MYGGMEDVLQSSVATAIFCPLDRVNVAIPRDSAFVMYLGD